MTWSRFFRRAFWDDERARELEAYIAEETDENIARGMAPDVARTAALRKLGNPALIREEIYSMNTIGFIDTLWQDVRYGLRLLRRNPTFAIVAILTLALGTGANTAIFEIADAVWLRALPVPDPETLVQIQNEPHKGGRSGDRTGRYSVLSVPEWEQLRDRQTVFSSIAAWGTAAFDIARGGPVQGVEGIWVSGSFFDTLGVRPFRGRTLTAADDREGCGSPGIVVSYAFWQRQFGGSPVIGRTLSLNGHPVEVVGITPPDFTGIEVGRSFDVAAPLCAEPLLDGAPDSRPRSTFWFLGAIGRLAPGISVLQAGAALAALSPSIYRATVPPTYDARDREKYLALTLTAAPAASGVSTLRQDARPVWILLGITGVVFLIACANLANLMLARATTRRREISVRLAIGASRGRVVRQLVSEGLLIAIIGSGVGLLIARWSTASLIALVRRTNPALWIDVRADGHVFAFASATAILACLIFAVGPALLGTAVNPGAAMKMTGVRGTTDSAPRVNLRSAFVVIQIALSFVLVAGALLFARTLRNLATEEIGFEPSNVLVAALDLTPVSVPANASAMFHDRLMTRIRAIPGVESAAEVSVLPIDGSGWNGRIVIDGREASTVPMFNAVTPGFFAAMQSSIVAGRDFQRTDASAAPIAIVNETFVRDYFRGGNPLGRTFDRVTPVGTPRPRYTVVGVVRDSKYNSLRQPFLPIAYLDMEQIPAADANPHLMVRTRLPIALISGSVTQAIAEIDPRISLRYRTMQSVIDGALSRERLMAVLSAFFSGLATVIAMIGLYGAMSYVVARRRIEIGIRMALGAEARSVVWMVVGQAGTLLAVGLLIGGALSVAAARTAGSLLYGVAPWDPATLAICAASLGGIALAASWVPAHRASRVDPTIALREE